VLIDEDICAHLPKNDSRINFIYDRLKDISKKITEKEGGFIVKKGNVLQIWKELLMTYPVKFVFVNQDYEPYAIQMDDEVADLCRKHGVGFQRVKDQVIFAKDDILKKDGKKNRWCGFLFDQVSISNKSRAWNSE
jgi:deoxyribodipyrimidine photo-lyase